MTTKKLQVLKIAMAFPLKMDCFAKGKKAMVTNKNNTACFINLVIISTGVVNL
jgi:hypothetical protein